MDSEKLHEIASDQLNRVLSFFARVDAKASTLFAINAGLLGVLALNANWSDLERWYTVFGVIAAVGICASLWFLYQCGFPQLKGGANSLIYFREIAQVTEQEYVRRVRELNEENYTNDVLGQIWRNSEILKIKFDCLRSAFILTALTLIPWFLFLSAASVYHSQLPAVR